MIIEKLSGDFIIGYTKAIQDISEVFDYVNNDLKQSKDVLELLIIMKAILNLNVRII